MRINKIFYVTLYGHLPVHPSFALITQNEETITEFIMNVKHYQVFKNPEVFLDIF